MIIHTHRFLGGVLLLLGATVATSFPIQSPVAQSAVQRPNNNKDTPDTQSSSSLNMVSETKSSSSSSSSSSSKEASKGEHPAAGLLKAFFRGVTLPFPMLRKLADSASPQAKTKMESLTEDPHHRVGFSLNESLLAIALYLALGVAAYSSHFLIQEDQQPWSLIDALYFSVVTFTTVGYGDLYPTTLAGKIFTVCFGLFGISILGAAIATIGSQVMEKETQMMQAAQEAGRRSVLEFWETNDDDEANKNGNRNGNRNNARTSTSQENEKPPITMLRLLVRILKNAYPSLSVLLAGGLSMGYIEGWSWTDSIYYSFITAGTLGYGDLSPVTQNGRLWAVVFIPLAVGAAGEVLGGVASWMVQRRRERFYKSQLERELNIERLLEMDADDDKKVSREEYVEFMLKEMEMVDQDVFRELHEQFNKLDADGGGYLDKRDLRLMVSRREQERAQSQAQGK
jgi:potassium channel subfamily K